MIEHGYADASTALAYLKNAVKFAAPITHPDGNRRFEGLLLTIEDGRVTDLAIFEPDCMTCGDTKVFVAYDPDGTERRWPCPDCRRVDKRRSRQHTRERNYNR